MTGELDENALRDIEERLGYLRNLGERKKTLYAILKSRAS